jgi:hypothetical protein
MIEMPDGVSATGTIDLTWLTWYSGMREAPLY